MPLNLRTEAISLLLEALHRESVLYNRWHEQPTLANLKAWKQQADRVDDAARELHQATEKIFTTRSLN